MLWFKVLEFTVPHFKVTKFAVSEFSSLEFNLLKFTVLLFDTLEFEVLVLKGDLVFWIVRLFSTPAVSVASKGLECSRWWILTCYCLKHCSLTCLKMR